MHRMVGWSHPVRLPCRGVLARAMQIARVASRRALLRSQMHRRPVHHGCLAALEHDRADPGTLRAGGGPMRQLRCPLQ